MEYFRILSGNFSFHFAYIGKGIQGAETKYGIILKQFFVW